MRRGLKITFVLCPEKVYKYIVVSHDAAVPFPCVFGLVASRVFSVKAEGLISGLSM